MKYIITLFFLFSLPLFSLPEDLIRKECRHDPYDPCLYFSNQSKIPMRRGKKLDTSERRPIKILNAYNTEYKNEQKIIFANYYHQKKFYVASVHPNQLYDVIYQTWFFPVKGDLKLAHIQIRFDFKNPIVLYEQKGFKIKDIPTWKRIEHFRPRSLIFSGEVVGIKGEGWDPFKGMIPGLYKATRRITSLEEKIDWMLVQTPNSKVMQHRIIASDQIKRALLMSALKDSHLKEISENYNTLFYSCATISNDILQNKVIELRSFESSLKQNGNLFKYSNFPNASFMVMALKGAKMVRLNDLATTIPPTYPERLFPQVKKKKKRKKPKTTQTLRESGP